MNIISCPLCNGVEVKLIERVTIEELNTLYFQAYQLEILYLFKENDIFFFCECRNCSLKFFEPSIIGDEHFYNILQKTNLYYMEDKEEYDFANKFITSSDNVLDIGCGKGAFSKRIISASFTGLELSSNAKEIGNYEGVTIFNQTIQEHCVFNKDKYDVVCAFQVLEHVYCNELFSFLKGSIDCLKKNGFLIISVPSNDSFISKMTNSVLNLPPHHQTHWPDRALKEIAKIFNLLIVDLHHDTLAPRHRSEYLRVIVMHFLTTKHRLIKKQNNLLQKISLRIINLINKQIKDFIINKINPYGHSITVIYQKIL
jgi:2-polyprenyl-3-methyl-5-hydroxy-6-metoxy-1,4-benzoquinol methylase